MTTSVVLDASELRDWMRTHNYTVRSLAQALDVNYRTVQRWRDAEFPVPRAIELALSTLERQQPATTNPFETQAIDVEEPEVTRERFED